MATSALGNSLDPSRVAPSHGTQTYSLTQSKHGKTRSNYFPKSFIALQSPYPQQIWAAYPKEQMSA
ncbi:hypothetical protein BVC80_1431g5 [Macleaya cordata]|uniref:Uncharacterized protein n=1 Tax=Macleaya cordata TaxID=56857 RepID=A0A200PZR2_MACCD|nr:hypothetical protein BVC80_1431g5 [Macleaya cordata]